MGRFSRDLLEDVSARSHCERFWHRQGCALHKRQHLLNKVPCQQSRTHPACRGLIYFPHWTFFPIWNVPAGSPSRGGDVVVYAFLQFEITSQACPLLCSLFLCLFLSLWLFQLYFISETLRTALRFFTVFFRSYFCLIGPFNYISFMIVSLQPSALN